jgi:DNA-binding NarL/FixJ family response regulator
MVVDDEPKLRSAWERLLRMHPDIEVVPSLERADDLVAMVGVHHPDIVLIDLTMPGRAPLDALTEASRRCPNCRFIVYSGTKNAGSIRQAANAGAWAFVDKIDPPEQILGIIRRVASGERLCHPPVLAEGGSANASPSDSR